MRQVNLKLASGEAVLVYSGDGRIVLQVRRLVHGAEDPAAASYKSGAVLTAPEAARVAAELLAVASMLAKDSATNLGAVRSGPSGKEGRT